jgi:hypothetical protein
MIDIIAVNVIAKKLNSTFQDRDVIKHRDIPMPNIRH